MIQTMIIWNATVPAAIALAVLVLLRPWRRRPTPMTLRLADMAPALALGGAYIVGHWSTVGGPGLGVNGGLLTAVIGATVVGALEAGLRLRWWTNRALRLVWSVVAAVVVVLPLAEPQGWSTGLLLAHIAGMATLIMVVWMSMQVMANRSFGPAAPAAAGLLLLGSVVAVTIGGLASTGQLLGPLVAAQAVIFIAALVRPRWMPLLGGVPVVSTAVAVHWGAAWLYGSLPLLSLVLLAGGSLLLMIGSRPTLRNVRPVMAVASHLALAALLLVVASLPAAGSYFSSEVKTLVTGDKDPGGDDYGYE